jgi:hypothetical protein
MKRLIKGIVKGILLEMVEEKDIRARKDAANIELDAYFESEFPRGRGIEMERREDARARIGASIEILRTQPEREISDDIFMRVKDILGKNGLLDGKGEWALNSIKELYVMDDPKDILMHREKVEELLDK